ncbi:phosphatidylserine decarboxylase [Rhodanobacter sp. AS-Z3]|uniref:phosphatidylserine decarboxylase n=1 Tax=Rhodanobacter sp. AS-Z3 TaxID=3031330 RepID=UPI002478571D|nr:phosphatidylserine decarboxylase [Rhodanobacter sp. AS-Z3]WEN15368.1 phosphatidylserine decarboxylase [Rhodanobacter sp. AS-Z3]
MTTLAVQLVVLLLLSILIGMWATRFPYPAPWLRRFLSPKLRWPERQIRGWLQNGRFHPGFLGFFNRDPHRVPPPEAGLVAPADGLITSAEVRDGVRYLVIALTFWDMHVQRSPAAGRVVTVEPSGDQLMDGEGRDFSFLREKHCPVQTRIVIDTEEFGRLAVRLITSIAARRIEVWPEEGSMIERGQRLGRILLGSTVVLEMPEALPVCAVVGQRVCAGETLVTAGATP